MERIAKASRQIPEVSTCTNYAPVQRQLLRDVFGVEPPPGDYKGETWPGYAAPIVRGHSSNGRDSVLATFGLVPRERIPDGVKAFDTTNAVGDGRREAKFQRRLEEEPTVPSACFYEPNYEARAKVSTLAHLVEGRARIRRGRSLARLARRRLFVHDADSECRQAFAHAANACPTQREAVDCHRASDTVGRLADVFEHRRSSDLPDSPFS
jgi:hypothetical protein